METVNGRLLQLGYFLTVSSRPLWAAGDKTSISTENGATVLTFPLSGQLAGVMVKATLDARMRWRRLRPGRIIRRSGDLLTETEYTDYADHGEILTDVKSPGHIIREQSPGRAVQAVH